MAGWNFHPTVNVAIDDAAREFGVDPDALRVFARIESGGRPGVTTGSYRGLFQMSQDEFAKYGGRGSIYDPAANARAAAAKLRAETEDFTRKHGRAPTPAELYLVHQQGAAGTAAHMGNPDGVAWRNVRPYYSDEAARSRGFRSGDEYARAAIWGNVPSDVRKRYPGGVDSLTSRQFTDLWTNKVAGFGAGAPPARAARTDRFVAPPEEGKIYFEPDQSTRPMRGDGYAGQMTGRVTVNGRTYGWASGGAGRGALPPGEYDASPMMTGAQRAQQGYSFTRDAFPLSDKADAVPGDPVRRGLLVHELGRGGATAGCIGIDGSFIPFSKDFTAEMAAKRGLTPAWATGKNVVVGSQPLGMEATMANAQDGPGVNQTQTPVASRQTGSEAVTKDGAMPIQTIIPQAAAAGGAGSGGLGPVLAQDVPNAFRMEMAKQLMANQLTKNPGAFESVANALAKGLGAYTGMAEGEKQSKLLAGMANGMPAEMRALALINPQAAMQLMLQTRKEDQEMRRLEFNEKSRMAQADTHHRQAMEQKDREIEAKKAAEANDPKNWQWSERGAYRYGVNVVTGARMTTRRGEVIDSTPGTAGAVPKAGKPGVPIGTTPGQQMPPVSMDGTMPPPSAPPMPAAPPGITLADAPPAAGAVLPTGGELPPGKSSAPRSAVAPVPPVGGADPASAPLPAGPMPVAAPAASGSTGGEPPRSAVPQGFDVGRNGTYFSPSGYEITAPSDGSPIRDSFLRGRWLYSQDKEQGKHEYDAAIKDNAEQTKALRAATDSWRNTKPVVDRVEQSVVNGFRSGARVGPLGATMRSLLGGLGVDVKGQTDDQIIQAGANNLVPAIRKGLPGSVSNYEMQSYLQSVMNLGNTQQANLLLAHFMRKAGSVADQDAELAADFRKQKRSLGLPDHLDDGFTEFVDEYYKQKPIFDEKDRALLDAASKGASVAQLVEMRDGKEAPLLKSTAAPEPERRRRGKERYLSTDGVMPKPTAPAAASPAAPTGPPKPGDIIDGYRFKGGNPSDQGSWEKV